MLISQQTFCFWNTEKIIRTVKATIFKTQFFNLIIGFNMEIFKYLKYIVVLLKWLKHTGKLNWIYATQSQFGHFHILLFILFGMQY